MMLRTLATAVSLIALWLLMSGLFKPLLISFGVISVLLVLFIMRRMDLFEDDHLYVLLKPVAFLKYFAWLLGEIAKSTWSVSRVILSESMPIRQKLFEVPSNQKTELGQVIFANSITLTPGTITVETEGTKFLVHALQFSDGDREALNDMGNRVCETERKRS